MFMAMAGMLMFLLEGYARAGRLFRVQRRAVTAEYRNRRPLRQHRNGFRVEILERTRGVNDLAVHDGQHGLDLLDIFLRNGEIILA